jgi:hypothetical protein
VGQGQLGGQLIKRILAARNDNQVKAMPGEDAGQLAANPGGSALVQPRRLSTYVMFNSFQSSLKA